MGGARLGALVAAAAFLGAACGTAGDGGDDRATVLASVYPLAEAADRVGGGRVDVLNLTPVGAEPHDVELSPDDVDRMLDADVLLYLSGEFQPAVEKLAARRDGLSLDLLSDAGGADGDRIDPHVWLDPPEMIEIVERVAEALRAVDPQGRDDFAANAADYIADLEGLHDRFRDGLAECARRTLVVSHAAFGRLADRYDLRQEPITGLSPESEPDPERLAQLIDLVEREGATTIFTEPLTPADVAETLARETGTRVAILNPIEGLTSDQEDEGATYLTLMEANLAAIAEALGCAT